MEKLYNLARGTVRLSITAPEPERILNFCAENGVEFWDTSPKNEFCICTSIHAADFPKFSSQNGKNGCEIKLLSAKGGKNITKAMKRRYALCIGFGLCVILLAVSSLFVWRVDIKGNETVSDGEIYRALDELGVHSGVFWPSISSDDVRSEFLIKMPELAWISVNVKNSCAEIVVHERIEKPEIVNEDSFADIIAVKSGVITKLSVLEGKEVVSVGDTVIKGDTLISGIVDSETAQSRFVHALGTVQAQTWYELSAQTPLYETVKTDIKSKKTKYSLVIGKKRIKILSDSRNKYPSCDKINRLSYADLNGAFALPVGIIKEQWCEYKTETKRIDKAAAVERLKQTLLSELKQSINGGSITDTNFTVSEDEKLLTVTLRAQCVENIGAEND